MAKPHRNTRQPPGRSTSTRAARLRRVRDTAPDNFSAQPRGYAYVGATRNCRRARACHERSVSAPSTPSAATASGRFHEGSAFFAIEDVGRPRTISYLPPLPCQAETSRHWPAPAVRGPSRRPAFPATPVIVPSARRGPPPRGARRLPLRDEVLRLSARGRPLSFQGAYASSARVAPSLFPPRASRT